VATAATRLNGVQFGVNDLDVYVAAFGAVGGGTDDTTAIQAAITFAQAAGGGTVHLMNSNSLISTALLLSNVPIRILGSHFGASVLTASASINAIFQFSDTSENTFFQFADFGLNGAGLANYGIVSAKIDHTLCYRLRVQNTLTAGISFGGGVTGQGYCNDFINCELANNSGDGLQITGQQTSNAANVRECNIFLNSGIGINSTGGAGLNIAGCVIETNLKAGIYLQLLSRSGRIVGNYLERNGTTGYAMTAPNAKTIKADIIVNGSSTATTMNTSNPCSGLEISGNYTTATATANAFAYLLSVTGCRVENNTMNDTNRPLIASTAQGAGAANVTGLQMRSNSIPAAGVLVNIEDATTSNVQFNTADWYIDSTTKKNYFSQVPQDSNAIIQSNSNPVTWSLSATTYNGDIAMEMAAVSGSSDIIGQGFTIANYPELAGQVVYFAAWVKSDSAATGIALSATGPGTNTSSVLGDTNWHFVQTTAVMPSSGSVAFGFEKFGASAKVYVARPVLAIVGASYPGFVFTPATNKIADAVTAYGALASQSIASTSTTTTVSSPLVEGIGSYWSSSANPFPVGFFGQPTNTSGAGQMVFSVNGTNEWVMNTSGVLKPVSNGNIFCTYYATQSQIVAGATSTTITPSSGGLVYLNLVTATNVTTMTVSAGNDGQELEVHVVQPASGSAATVTTTWANVSFSTATAIAFTATLGRRDIVKLKYVSATSKWYEVSRSLNIVS
jgi:Right handed beta helix region